MSATRILTAITLAALLFPLGACDLDVTNPNEPSRERALSNADDIRSLIRSQWRVYWAVAQDDPTDEGSPGAALDATTEIISSNSANDGTWDQGMMPPEAIINQVGYRWGPWMRDPWLQMNRALAAVRDGLQSIEDRNLDLEDAERIEAFSKFLQGLFHGYIALMYDRGFILDETVADPADVELSSYTAMMQAAMGYLAEARSIAAANDFDLPDGWLGPASYTSDELVRLTHSYQARFMTAVARSPSERDAVDWDAVMSHVDQGITEDFGVDLDGPGGVWGAYYKGAFGGRGTSLFLPFIGVADQSGEYIAWENTAANNRMPFEIDTDDRRITDGTPTGAGVLVEYRSFFSNQVARGTWFLSNYAPLWHRGIADTGFGFAEEITLQEMAFLKAEAYIRNGMPAMALDVINDGRVSDGELPEATVDGVDGARCVPRAIGPLMKVSGLAEGACGDLMTTLAYEKRIELFHLTSGLAFFDARGWGMLRAGRPIHVPIPMEDLQVLGIPFYTFGGGGEGSAS
ncbi:MAG: hypothetical protein GWO00_04685 [Gemmatimonadetes bacterium]|nr:hypothetical protein [Gemmatimonadota bacterium]NIR77698.1 hypothetical protein [Gemmatimonadota bacterium]NIT86244.1 hypothetical protein [Gemmatimonadota bacterium]NIU30070.1 hypothetical protein [Gemmatimonadota bacterium]NIV60472.1 hypothetical protein [Gemmatimonadota bacterium]